MQLRITLGGQYALPERSNQRLNIGVLRAVLSNIRRRCTNDGVMKASASLVIANTCHVGFEADAAGYRRNARAPHL